MRFAVLLLPSSQLSQTLVRLCTPIPQICHVSPLPELIKAIPFTKLEICPKRAPRLCFYTWGHSQPEDLWDEPGSVAELIKQ